MAASLVAAARQSGLDGAELAAVERAHLVAMGPRVAALPDDHHPAYLHPGRSALIILRDVGPVQASVLTLAMLHESEDDWLRPKRDQIEDALGGEAGMATLDTLPRPGEEDLVERLLLLDPGVALATLAERLDHLRHLHMRPDLSGTWADAHAEVVGVWLPFSHRIHSRLAGRFTHWVRAFGKRIRS